MSNRAIVEKNITAEEQNTDFEIRSLDTICINTSYFENKWYDYIKYMIIGILCGIVLVKGQVISWFRSQEMFRLQSFYMYGVIGTAVAVGMISVLVIKKFNIKTVRKEVIDFPKKKFSKGQI